MTAPRFLADAMLERLARWLRVLGLDVVSATTERDATLVRQAAAEGRVLLTRDRRLPHEQGAAGCVVLAATAPLEQLREVVARCALADVARQGGAWFTRCLLCNTVLGESDGDAEPGVPPDVRRRGERVRRCPTCGRLYWEGAHTRRMRAAVERALGPQVD